jgi:hypothetical protein
VQSLSFKAPLVFAHKPIKHQFLIVAIIAE